MNFALTAVIWFFIIGWASMMLAMLVGFLFKTTDDRRHQYYAEEGAWSDCDCWECRQEQRMSEEDWDELAGYVADLKSGQARERKHWGWED